MNIKIDNALFRGAHVCSVLVSAFCGDELLLHAVARAIASFEQSSRRQNAFASSPRDESVRLADTLQACARQRFAANQPPN
jgi:hypothetical protein